MKVLFDANVWLAAQVSKGTCEELVQTAPGKVEILICPDILLDLEEKLRGKFQRPEAEVIKALGHIHAATSFEEDSTLETPVCRDPDDDVLLATAREHGCGYLVTGDKDLLVLGEFEGVRIVSPRVFLDWLRAQGEQ